MKIFKPLTASVLTLVATTGVASAACVTGSSTETSLQGILDNITVSGSSSVDAATDCIADSTDSIWAITGSGLSGTTMVIEIAGNASTNTFGIYDSTDSSNYVELFNGAASSGAQTVMSIKLDGSVYVGLTDTGKDFAGNSFGYYLGFGTGGGKFFSDSALNGGADQMLAYQGTGDTISVGGNQPGTWTQDEYILAWEDLPGSSADNDFNDMVLIVESVETVVPVPAAVWLFGTGLLGLVGVARRRA